MFGAYYYQNEKFYIKAKEILINELDEQILKDGAHFELSPMYHQIMLFRLLDCINLVKNNNYKDKELLSFLKEKSFLMLSWLSQITFGDGSIPLFNDSATKIAPNTNELLKYAKELDISFDKIKLYQSGYRKIKKQNYECVVDVGDIGPSYIPGHAHADTFNFELYIHDSPFIVDTGISTYEPNETRLVERSTISHNTVLVQNINQSEVWGSFRVGNRASIIALNESKDKIEASHNGYSKLGLTHKRKWFFEETKLIIEDTLTNDSSGVFLLHFHPSITEEEIFKRIKSSGKIEIKEYNYANQFNNLKKAKMLMIDFQKNIKVEILI